MMATYDYDGMKRLEDLPEHEFNGGDFVTLIKGKKLLYIPKRIIKKVTSHHDTCDVKYNDEGLVVLDLNADGPYRLRPHSDYRYDDTDVRPRTLSVTKLLRRFGVDENARHLVPCKVEGNLIVMNLSEREKTAK